MCGSLELASKNMIAGSVRMVYAIIYSLFLGFGIAIGSDVWFLLDPASRQSMYVPLESSTKVDGSFILANQTLPLWTGGFTFTNGTSNALNAGTINCERLPEWPWYRQPVSPWFNFLFVPTFSLLSCFNLLQPMRSWDLPVMVFIACAGWTANMAANHFVFNRSDVVSAIGSFVIGILGNVYSRVFRGTAFTATAVAVLFLVPSGMAMAGGLAMTYKGSDGDLYSNGLSFALRMVQVSRAEAHACRAATHPCPHRSPSASLSGSSCPRSSSTPSAARRAERSLPSECAWRGEARRGVARCSAMACFLDYCV